MGIFKSNDIISATKAKNISMVKRLINSVNIDYKDKNHKTALFYAVENSDIEILNLLIKHGANVYIKDDRGLMAIDYAVLLNNQSVINYFLDNNFEFNLDNIKKSLEEVRVKDSRCWLNIIKKFF